MLKASTTHALNILGQVQASKHEQIEGKTDGESVRVSSGTYAKTC
jgi:hypothetical protein